MGSRNSILSWLSRSCKLQELDVAEFRGSGDVVAPPHVSRLTALTALTAMLAVSDRYEHEHDQQLPPPARLCAHLVELTRLQRLRLQQPQQRDTAWWPIVDSELEQLAAMLRALSGIADLSISRPCRWQAGHLAEAAFHRELAQMHSLTRLAVTGPLAGLTAGLASALVQLSSLKYLHLAEACGDEPAAAAPPSALSTADHQLVHLGELCIDSNSKRADGTSGLGAALGGLIACCPAVQTIDLNIAPLSDADGVALAASFACTTCLMRLTLPRCTGSGEGLVALAGTLVHLPQLQRFLIRTTDEYDVAGGNPAEVPDAVWREVLCILANSGRSMDAIVEVIRKCQPLIPKLLQWLHPSGRVARLG